MDPGKRSPLVEVLRKARLCASSRKCLRELKKESKKKKSTSASSDVWVAEARTFEKILNSPCCFCEVLTCCIM